jgi:adenylate cyclase
MFTDMVGSTAVAQSDEALALRLQDEQERLLRPLFVLHEGREVKSLGDGFLVEFDSALRAVQCAIDIQQRIHERNTDPARPPFQLRIGIHLGDVEARGSDIFGDTVNVASRIRPLAEPGGICVSEPVFGQVRNKLSCRFEELAPAVLNHVRFPLAIHRIRLPWDPNPGSVGPDGVTRLAVLPLANISLDPNDAYIADGLTEELITALSQVPELLVIARTSVLPYRATPKGIPQIGSELRVGRILEGSVRKAGDRLRITIQLIDVATQGHSWAQNYDRRLDDVFAMQSEIADQVAQALRVRFGHGTSARPRLRAEVQPDSYLAYIKGRTLMHEESEASLRAALQLFRKAVTLDGRNAAAHAGQAEVIRLLGWHGFERGVPRSEWDKAGRAAAARAIELDPELPEAHHSLGQILWDDAQWDAAEKEFRTVIASSPSHAAAHTTLGTILLERGRPEEALAEFQAAERADPLSLTALASLADLLCWMDRLDEAQVAIERMREVDPLAQRFHWQVLMYAWCRSDPVGVRREADWIIEHFQKERWHMEAICCALSGRFEEARTWIGQCDGSEGGTDPPIDIAFHYAVIGDLDECFRWLNVAVDRFQAPLGMWRTAPYLERVRSDPRFSKLLLRMNLG